MVIGRLVTELAHKYNTPIHAFIISKNTNTSTVYTYKYKYKKSPQANRHELLLLLTSFTILVKNHSFSQVSY